MLARLVFGSVALNRPWQADSVCDSGLRKIVEATTKLGDKIWILPLGFYDCLNLDRLPASGYRVQPWLSDSFGMSEVIIMVPVASSLNLDGQHRDVRASTQRCDLALTSRAMSGTSSNVNRIGKTDLGL